MKKFRWFHCDSCKAKSEHRVEDGVKTVKCKCGEDAVKMLSAPKYFGNTTGKSPSVN